MGRMIDAEKFKEHFCEENCGNRRCRDEFDKCTFIMALEQEPTAYDLDKVVEQLEELGQKMSESKSIQKYGESSPANHSYKAVSVKRAIEIVKGGGADAN